jgi:hypothetical protein
VAPAAGPRRAGLSLRLFIVLLPLLLLWLDRRAGLVAGSALDSQLATQYFVFQVSGPAADSVLMIMISYGVMGDAT